MIEGSLSRRYTKALFQLARDDGQEEKIGQEVEQFYAAYSGSDLQQVLTNPAFRIEARKKILNQVTASQQLSALTSHFLSLLLDRDRLPYLPGIVSCYRRLLNEAKGRIDAKVVSASALEPERACPIERSVAQHFGQRRGFAAGNRCELARWPAARAWKEKFTTAAFVRSLKT